MSIMRLVQGHICYLRKTSLHHMFFCTELQINNGPSPTHVSYSKVRSIYWILLLTISKLRCRKGGFLTKCEVVCRNVYFTKMYTFLFIYTDKSNSKFSSKCMTHLCCWQTNFSTFYQLQASVVSPMKIQITSSCVWAWELNWCELIKPNYMKTSTNKVLTTKSIKIGQPKIGP